MKQLWAPWRMEYIASPQVEGCIFCEAFREVGREREHGLLYRDCYALVMLNRFPYGNGHLLVCPAQHGGDPQAL
ncbi:MAG: HIT family hydrolase, partial [Deltaproteobacteria bacterium]|nr:HIT family hydrolase [Deltaproteobacteria bacterium]